MPVQLIARGLPLIVSGVAGWMGYEFSADDKSAEAVVSGVVTVVTLMTAWKWRKKPPAAPPVAALFLLLVGCVDGPVNDPAQVERYVRDMTARVNAVALEAAEYKPAVDLACSLRIEQSCKALRAAYAAVDLGVTHAHKLVSVYAEFGQGLDATRIGIEALERALDGLVAQAEEVQDGVVGIAREAGVEVHGHADQREDAGVETSAPDPADGGGRGGDPATAADGGVSP